MVSGLTRTYVSVPPSRTEREFLSGISPCINSCDDGGVLETKGEQINSPASKDLADAASMPG